MYLLEHSEFAFVLKVFQTPFYFIVLFMKRIFISQRFNFFLLTPAKDATVLSSIYCCYRAGVLLNLTRALIR